MTSRQPDKEPSKPLSRIQQIAEDLERANAALLLARTAKGILDGEQRQKEKAAPVEDSTELPPSR